MTLPASPNTITLAMVNTELGYASNAAISLNDTAVRTLAGRASGTISMSDLHGKSAAPGDGMWIYAPNHPQYFAAYDIAYMETTWAWNAEYFGGSASPSLDSLSRLYYETGGKRYTKGRTYMGSEGDYEYYKICRTDAGVQAPSTGD